jgi:hypothetical protein
MIGQYNILILIEHAVWFNRVTMSRKTIYHSMKSLNARMAVNYKRGIGPTKLVLILTTIGANPVNHG